MQKLPRVPWYHGVQKFVNLPKGLRLEGADVLFPSSAVLNGDREG